MHALIGCKLLESLVVLIIIIIIIYHHDTPPTGRDNFLYLAHSVRLKGGRGEEAETVIKWLSKHYFKL